ncbi:chitobiase/beta-hexosaminidase C-terminal domain-containing protein [Spirochaeta dissipatitropha]
MRCIKILIVLSAIFTIITGCGSGLLGDLAADNEGNSTDALFSSGIVADRSVSAGTAVEFWLTNPSTNVWLQRQSDLQFEANSSNGNVTITVNPDEKFQVMDGFGASLTEASTWLLKNQLSPQKRAEVLENLFGPSGIHMSLLRQPMGASDFNFEAWTYGDTPGNVDDFNLDHFSLDRELDSIRPILDMAMGIDEGRIKIMSSPWSPPAWMKTGKHLYGNQGGSLRSDVYDVYAEYFLRYLQEYDALGTPVFAITVQNEPKFAAPWPGMLMSAQEQINFINVLGPLLQQNGYGDVKIIAYDHNYDDIDYARAVLNSSANQYVAGSAWHYYSALSHENLTTLHNEFPDKGHWFTEGGTGTWIGGGTDEGMFLDLMMHTIRFPRNWSKSYITWNVALDQNSGPSLDGIDDSNRGLLTIRSDAMDDVEYTNTYYGLGHSSRFVHPGAVRIGSTTSNNVETVAYQNTDGSIALVLLNNARRGQNVKVHFGDVSFTASVPGRAAATFAWEGGAPVAEMPSASHASGNFSDPFFLSLSTSTEGGEIRYTLDGSEPVSSSLLYSDPLYVDESVTVKARTYHPEMSASAVLTLNYSYDDGTAPPVVESSVWHNNFEDGLAFSAGGRAAVRLVNESANTGGNKAVELTVRNSGYPGATDRSVYIRHPEGAVISALDYSHLVFFGFDMVGNNTVYVTGVDSNGNTASAWTETAGAHNSWTKFVVPLNALSLQNIVEIRLGQWNNGTYLFDDVYFTQSSDGELPPF